MVLRYTAILREALENYLQNQRLIHLSSSVVVQYAFEELSYIAVEGKLLRGSLFLEGFTPSEIPAYAIDIAMAMELVHSAFLIHDDIMDQSVDRRGRPSLHISWAQYRSSSQQSSDQFLHYGISQAICVGDLAIFLAQELLLKSGYRGQIDILRFVQKLWARVCLGQIRDIDLGSYPYSRGCSVQEILSMYEEKTAFYTFSLPLVCFALCSEWSLADQERLLDLGRNLGLLFQIRDDELDIFGDPKRTKKHSGQDIRERKKTLHLCLLYEELSEDEREEFEQMSQTQGPLSPHELEQVKQWLRRYSIKEKIQVYTKKLRGEVKEHFLHLENQTLTPILTKILESLEQY